MPSPLPANSARISPPSLFCTTRSYRCPATGYIPAEVIEIQQRDTEAAAKAAVDRFTAAASRAGISAEQITLSASFAGAGDQFGRIARRFDLAIVGQAVPKADTLEEIIAENTLFESGRPVIVVPYIQKAPLKLDRVMACWDGSRPAARAIADAMPLLEKRRPRRSRDRHQ